MNKPNKEKAFAMMCAALVTCASIPIAVVITDKANEAEAAVAETAEGSGQTKEQSSSENAQAKDNDGTKTTVIEGDDTLYSDGTCEHGTSSSDNGKPQKDIMEKSSGTNKNGVYFSLKNGSIIEKENEIRYWQVHKGRLYINLSGKLTQRKLAEETLHFVDAHGNRVAPSKIADTLVIGKDVTSISNNTFEGWDISSLSFEKGSKCTSIGSSAFRDCYILKKVSIPKSVKKVGSYAFRNCHKKLKVVCDAPATTSVAATAYKKDTTETSAMSKRCLKVKAKTMGKKKIEVSWNKISKAKRYVVFYKKSTAKNYKKKSVDVKSGKTQQLVIKSLKRNSRYSIHIIAYKSKKTRPTSAIVKSTETKLIKIK